MRVKTARLDPQLSQNNVFRVNVAGYHLQGAGRAVQGGQLAAVLVRGVFRNSKDGFVNHCIPYLSHWTMAYPFLWIA